MHGLDAVELATSSRRLRHVLLPLSAVLAADDGVLRFDMLRDHARRRRVLQPLQQLRSARALQRWVRVGDDLAGRVRAGELAINQGYPRFLLAALRRVELEHGAGTVMDMLHRDVESMLLRF